MGLVKDIRKRLEVPGESGSWVEVRMLSWLRLEEARKKRVAAAVESMRSLSGLNDMIEEARAKTAPQANGAAKSAPDRLSGYDMLTLFRGGIVSWSYGEYSPELAEELDETTALWLAKEILDYALPTESQVKDVASRSTTS